MEISGPKSILMQVAEVEKQITRPQERREEAETILQSLRKQLERCDFETASTDKTSDNDYAPTAQND